MEQYSVTHINRTLTKSQIGMMNEKNKNLFKK